MAHLPEPIRQAFRRSSVGLAVAGLATVVSSLTAIAAIGGDDRSPRADSEMTLSAVEDEVTTTTVAVEFAPVEAPGVQQPAAVKVAKDDDQDRRLDEHEERLAEMEILVVTTTTTNLVPNTMAPMPTVQQPNSETEPVVTSTTLAAPTTTTTVVPAGEWKEAVRFTPDTPAEQWVALETGYLRCRNLGTETVVVNKEFRAMSAWTALCTVAGGETSDIVRRVVRDEQFQVVPPAEDFLVIIEEYRCNVPGCVMPTVG